MTIENNAWYGGETALTQVKRMKRIGILNGVLDAMTDQIEFGASSRYREIEKLVSMDKTPFTTSEVPKNRERLRGTF